MARYRFTAFPSLQTGESENYVLGEPQRVKVSHGLQVDREAVIIAWTQLLRCYTSHEDICFLVNNEAVAKSADSSSFETIPHSAAQGVHVTGVFLDQVGLRCT